MAVDFIQNIEGFGDAADRLISNNFDVGVLRPWLGKDGRSYVAKTVDGKPKIMVTNTPATLTWYAWKQFDDAIVKTILLRQRAFADIRAAGLTYNLPNGMAHTVLQYQTTGDVNRATISMDPIRRGEADRPQIDVGNLPLPIIHKDFDFSAREIMVSKNGALPLDTGTAELAATKVAEELEMLTIGTSGSFAYGGGTIYGYINFPYRSTKTDLTVPTGSNGTTVLNEILTLRQMLIDDRHFGPYMLYVNSQWSQVMDNDFKANGDKTLRERILGVSDIKDVRTLDFLPTTHWNMVLVEMNSLTVRAVVGMEVQTVQWESLGGMMKHFKVMCLLVPQLRPDTAGNSGIGHGTSATA